MKLLFGPILVLGIIVILGATGVIDLPIISPDAYDFRKDPDVPDYVKNAANATLMPNGTIRYQQTAGGPWQVYGRRR